MKTHTQVKIVVTGSTMVAAKAEISKIIYLIFDEMNTTFTLQNNSFICTVTKGDK